MEVRAQIETVHDAIAAMQSLDDLGAEANARAHRDEQELWKRLRTLEAHLAQLEKAPIKATRDYAQRGYASAASVIKPWVVYVYGRRLMDKSGRPRRFSTEAAATAAAKRSIR